MIWIDSSAWTEFLRDTDSRVCNRVDKLPDADIASCDVIRVDVPAGARNERQFHELRRLLADSAILRIALADHDDATALFRQCRQQRKSVPKLTDCLIAPTAMREDMAVLRYDRKFDLLARCSGLRINGPHRQGLADSLRFVRGRGGESLADEVRPALRREEVSASHQSWSQDCGCHKTHRAPVFGTAASASRGHTEPLRSTGQGASARLPKYATANVDGGIAHVGTQNQVWKQSRCRNGTGDGKRA